MMSRKGESELYRFRSERFFHINGQYFFSTRECEEVGPFSSRNAAEKGLKRFLIAINAGYGGSVARSAAMGDTWAITNFQ